MDLVFGWCLVLLKKKVCLSYNPPLATAKRSVPNCGGLLVSAFTPRSRTFSYFLLSGVTVGFALAVCIPHFSQTSPNPPIPQSARRLQMMNLLNKQVKQRMTRTTCIIYVYIYIYMCVCVCTCVRMGSIHNITYLKRGADWQSKCHSCCS